MTMIANHPQRNTLRLQLRENRLLADLRPDQWEALEPLLVVGDYRKGDRLAHQGDEEMLQFFILEGMVKRVVSNPEGHEMILRFAAENEMDTSFAAWRLRTPIPYSSAAAPGGRGAGRRMPRGGGSLERGPDVRPPLEYRVIRLMWEVRAHPTTLPLLAAPGPLSRSPR